MPPHFTGGPPDGEVLTENAFRVSGYTLDIADFAVVDVASGEACQVRVETETTREVSARWADHPEPPPGAVQWKSQVVVHFSPATPGREYRLESMAGEVTAAYQGPAVTGAP